MTVSFNPLSYTHKHSVVTLLSTPTMYLHSLAVLSGKPSIKLHFVGNQVLSVAHLLICKMNSAPHRTLCSSSVTMLSLSDTTQSKIHSTAQH